MSINGGLTFGVSRVTAGENWAMTGTIEGKSLMS